METAPRPSGPGTITVMMTGDQLRAAVEDGSIETVVTAFTDMQGRLIGKRVQAEYFTEDVIGGGLDACTYLLAVDMDTEPMPGYELASPETGYADFHMCPDMTTLRRVSWLERTALVLCDLVASDGTPVRQSPRQILIEQYERAHVLGLTPFSVCELEFYLYHESYREAYESNYGDLTLSSPYIIDGHVLATTFDEPLIVQIRRGMQAAGIPVEFSRGEGYNGQHEINLRYSNAITAADSHAIYKNGVKEIAYANDVAATFMAKPSSEHMGSSCHIHMSLVEADSGRSVFVDEDG